MPVPIQSPYVFAHMLPINQEGFRVPPVFIELVLTILIYNTKVSLSHSICAAISLALTYPLYNHGTDR